jgi:hypothetical protein
MAPWQVEARDRAWRHQYWLNRKYNPSLADNLLRSSNPRFHKWADALDKAIEAGVEYGGVLDGILDHGMTYEEALAAERERKLRPQPGVPTIGPARHPQPPITPEELERRLREAFWCVSWCWLKCMVSPALQHAGIEYGGEKALEFATERWVREAARATVHRVGKLVIKSGTWAYLLYEAYECLEECEHEQRE